MRYSLVVSIMVMACGARTSTNTGGPDAAFSADACTGSDTRCSAGTYQTCVDGTFQTQATCANACVASLGCVQCDPAASNTCNGNDVVACNADGSYGATIMACTSAMMCTDGACNAACTADGVNLVYVVDEANEFLSFDPRLLPADPFHLIGTLACPTHGGSIQTNGTTVMPFSMSVDRDGKAWVEYTSGEIFNVSLIDASCTASGYVAQAAGMALFGMGFVTDTAGGTTEKLFIGGGGHAAEPQGSLDDVDTHAGNLTPQHVGTIAAASDFSPELTGTNEAKLYGFFPVITSGPAYVQEIDKASGAAVGMSWNLGAAGLGDQISDWAFAQWGGVFYIFVTTLDANGNPNSTVRSIDRTTNTYTVLLQNLPFRIDGAGVSTCAPSVIQ